MLSQIGAIDFIGGSVTGGSSSVDFNATSDASEFADGVTLNADLNLSGASGHFEIRDHLTLNGTANLAGSGATLDFAGTQTFGASPGQAATVEMAPFNAQLRVIDGGTLTLDDTVTVSGQGYVTGYGAGNAVVNDGLIHANQSNDYLRITSETFTNTGTLRASNGAGLVLYNDWDTTERSNWLRGVSTCMETGPPRTSISRRWCGGRGARSSWRESRQHGGRAVADRRDRLHRGFGDGRFVLGRLQRDVGCVRVRGWRHAQRGSEPIRGQRPLRDPGPSDAKRDGEPRGQRCDVGLRGDADLRASPGQAATVEMAPFNAQLRVIDGGTLTLDDTVTVSGQGYVTGYGAGNAVVNDGLIHSPPRFPPRSRSRTPAPRPSPCRRASASRRRSPAAGR